MLLNSYSIKKIYMGRLSNNDDLIESLNKIVTENFIKIGVINLIGAVKKATIAFYDQNEYKYNCKVFNEDLEILNCTGNISIKDGIPMVHCHITLSDKEGKAFGGHLMPDTIIFAAEYTIYELEGKELVRNFDPITKLALWL